MKDSKKRYYIGLQCLICNAILVSKHRHDFVRCDCSNQAFIDGGQNDYIRIGAMKISDVKRVLVSKKTGKVKKERS